MMNFPNLLGDLIKNKTKTKKDQKQYFKKPGKNQFDSLGSIKKQKHISKIYQKPNR